jgi:hypothetical protein
MKFFKALKVVFITLLVGMKAVFAVVIVGDFWADT